MLNFFKQDHYAKVERRRRLAEKQKKHKRDSARRKKRRTKAWQSFINRIKKIFVNPFANKELTSSDRERKRMKALIKRDRKISRQKAWLQFRQDFLTVILFRKRKLTEAQLEKKRIKIHQKRERKLAREKWWASFRENPWKTLFVRKKKAPDQNSYLYQYKITRKERREIAIQKRKKNREGINSLLSSADLRKKSGFAFLHSTAYFILSFMLFYILYQLVTIAVASSYNIPIVWYYYELKFPLYTYSPLYTRAALVTIFAAGPVLSLMLAFVFLKLYFTENATLKKFQLFFLWSFISGCTMFFGSYISGFFTRTEFIYTSEWLFMSGMYDIEEIIFTIIAFVTMIVIGRLVTPLFLLSSGSVTLIKPEFRLFFIISQVILPWLAGILILFLITLPNYYIPLILKTVTTILILGPSLFVYDSMEYDDIHKSGVINHNYFRWSIVIIAIAILFFYRVILSFGLKIL